MSTTILDVPRECNTIAVLYHGNVVQFASTKDAMLFCEKMRLRITGRDTQGNVYLIKAQKEDNTL